MPAAKVCRHQIPWDLWKRWLLQCPSDCLRAWMWFLLGFRPSAVPPLLPRDPMTVAQLHPKLLSKRNTKEIAGKSSQRISLHPRSGGNKHHNFRSWWMQINWGWADKLMTHQNQIASGTEGISGQRAESWNPDKSWNALTLCPSCASRELLQSCAVGMWLSASRGILFFRLPHPGMSNSRGMISPGCALPCPSTLLGLFPWLPLAHAFTAAIPGDPTSSRSLRKLTEVSEESGKFGKNIFKKTFCKLFLPCLSPWCSRRLMCAYKSSLGYLRDLFQPNQFHNSMILCF